MSNWYGTARTNYVSVANKEALLEAIKPWSLQVWWKGDNVAFGGDDDSGAFPSCTVDDDDNEIEFSFEEYVMPFLMPGEVLITQEIGAENMRYVTGHASAYKMINGGCEIIDVDINEIYGKVRTLWGDKPTRAEY